jgi:ABC-type Na+ efflux pump permease subunit
MSKLEKEVTLRGKKKEIVSQGTLSRLLVQYRTIEGARELNGEQRRKRKRASDEVLTLTAFGQETEKEKEKTEKDTLQSFEVARGA